MQKSITLFIHDLPKYITKSDLYKDPLMNSVGVIENIHFYPLLKNTNKTKRCAVIYYLFWFEDMKDLYYDIVADGKKRVWQTYKKEKEVFIHVSLYKTKKEMRLLQTQTQSQTIQKPEKDKDLEDFIVCTGPYFSDPYHPIYFLAMLLWIWGMLFIR